METEDCVGYSEEQIDLILMNVGQSFQDAVARSNEINKIRRQIPQNAPAAVRSEAERNYQLASTECQRAASRYQRLTAAIRHRTTNRRMQPVHFHQLIAILDELSPEYGN